MRQDELPNLRDLNGVVVLLASAKRKKAEGDLAGAVQILIAILEANPEILRAPGEHMGN